MRRKIIIFLKTNKRGFSMVGVLTAAGLLGGLALMLANLTRQQHVTPEKGRDGGGDHGAVQSDRQHPVR